VRINFSFRINGLWLIKSDAFDKEGVRERVRKERDRSTSVLVKATRD
jgi:hypothetical protein